jgi:hypothetical protein
MVVMREWIHNVFPCQAPFIALSFVALERIMRLSCLPNIFKPAARRGPRNRPR